MKLRDCIFLAAALAAGCGSSNTPGTPTPGDGGTPPPGDGGTPPPTGGTGPGTCANPIRLDMAARRDGMTLVYEGTTAGLGNNLQPYGETPSTDSTEAVLEFRVPMGMSNVRISTEGSAFDTIVYVREACSQAMGGVDVAFGDNTPTRDPAQEANHATIYLTNLTPGQVRFIVVDGRAMGMPPSGRFRLTIAPFTPGTMGNPCMEQVMGDPTCATPSLRCSPAARCVPTVATGMRCDDRGINDTCLPDAVCVADPSPPPEAMDNPAFCATPGTRPGTRCRDGMGAARCDAPLVCNDAMDTPTCVRRLGREQPCDPMGIANRCMEGLRCRTVGMATSFCEPAM